MDNGADRAGLLSWIIGQHESNNGKNDLVWRAEHRRLHCCARLVAGHTEMTACDGGVAARVLGGVALVAAALVAVARVSLASV